MPFPCIPPCKACKEAGECQQPDVLAPPASLVARRERYAGNARSRAARRAAIEKELTGYFWLSCGCVTTRQTQEFYSYWRPRNKRNRADILYWCESCQKWRTRERPVVRAPLPMEPLF